MHIDVILVHLVLAGVLFFVMNWIGGHSIVTASYHQISYFSRYDDAPAFNVVFRVLAPVVFTILVSAFLYFIEQPRFIESIYLVVIYQQAIRWGYLVVWGRRLLTRWSRQFLIASASIGIAYLAYRQILRNPTRLLPDFDNLANELWIIIIVFLYQVFNKVEAPSEGNAAQKVRYIRARFESLNRQYAAVINDVVPERVLQPFAYAVMIYETFNRPWLAQVLERLLPAGQLRSYGPMQVQAYSRISDAQSVRDGASRLIADYKAAYESAETSYRKSYPHWDKNQLQVILHEEAMTAAAKKHNIRSDYAAEVVSIHNILVEEFYRDVAPQTIAVG